MMRKMIVVMSIIDDNDYRQVLIIALTSTYNVSNNSLSRSYGDSIEIICTMPACNISTRLHVKLHNSSVGYARHMIIKLITFILA